MPKRFSVLSFIIALPNENCEVSTLFGPISLDISNLVMAWAIGNITDNLEFSMLDSAFLGSPTRWWKVSDSLEVAFLFGFSHRPLRKTHNESLINQRQQHPYYVFTLLFLVHRVTPSFLRLIPIVLQNYTVIAMISTPQKITIELSVPE